VNLGIAELMKAGSKHNNGERITVNVF